MGAGQDGTGTQSSFGLRERVSETGTRKERPLEGRSRPRGAKEAAVLMEECPLAPHRSERHSMGRSPSRTLVVKGAMDFARLRQIVLLLQSCTLSRGRMLSQ